MLSFGRGGPTKGGFNGGDGGGGGGATVQSSGGWFRWCGCCRREAWLPEAVDWAIHWTYQRHRRAFLRAMVLTSYNAIYMGAIPVMMNYLFAVALPNWGDEAAELRFCLADIGWPHGDDARARSVWAKQDLGAFSKSFSATVQSHDTLLLRISPAAPTAVLEA